MVFAAASLLMGYMVMNIKDVLRGKGPTSMFSDNPFERKNNWSRLADQSGALGIVSNIYGAVSDPTNERNFGPIWGTAGNLISDQLHGRHAEVRQDVLNTIPFNTHPMAYPIIHGIFGSIMADGVVELNDIAEDQAGLDFTRR
jgi:hypothetical protein